MTKRQGKTGTIDVKAVLAEDEEFLRALVRTALQEVLEECSRERPRPADLADQTILVGCISGGNRN